MPESGAPARQRPRRRGVERFEVIPTTAMRTNSEDGRVHRMPLRLCSVGFKSATGISHSVDVEAETLYEAAAVGLARLKKMDGLKAWVQELGSRSTSVSLAVITFCPFRRSSAGSTA